MSYSITRRSYVDPVYTTSRVVDYDYVAPVDYSVVETRRSIERPITTRVYDEVQPVYHSTRYVSPVRTVRYSSPVRESRIVTERISPSYTRYETAYPERVTRYYNY
eukprot:TRINITY_DN96_c0_g1_i4.p2 TRINITY_DN96_c0_g1~~TRINITY_DN96_c0_g1_i4.p2  ORF type:complete len:106 (+),score=23.61 TRINITY_DN96_c0_g1_i4:210-527(+)